MIESVITDLRDLKQYTADLQRQNAFLLGVFAATSDAVVITDTNGTIVMFNPGAEEFFGRTEKDVMGKTLWRLISGGVKFSGGLDIPRIKRALVRGEAVKNIRCRFTKTGTEDVRHGLVSINVVNGPDSPQAFVVVIKDNTEVEGLSQTDPLTKLVNRGAFDAKIEEEYARLQRGLTSTTSLLFLDIDHFGKFNKDYGHQVGDEVLRKVSATIGSTVRTVDTAARYGGEEFVVILPGTDQVGAERLAERLRENIAAIVIETGNGTVGVTTSIGVQTHGADSVVSTPKAFIREANRALLAAKQAGRDRVCTFRAA
jgi:diguanylate cyclase (GGDEF)-like protein/PAS domain S-box-containing protein